MRLALLTTARRLRPEAIEKIWEQLGVEHEDVQVTVVSWYPHEQPLPVAANLLIGPHPRLRHRARHLAVLDPAKSSPHHEHAGSGPVHTTGTEPKRAIPPRPAGPGAAFLWRVRHSAKLRRVAHRAARTGMDFQYAAASNTSREVSQAIRSADVVVALDMRTYLAAWVLARRHPQPSFVAGVAAAKRAIEARTRH